jgi:hypothetical protein
MTYEHALHHYGQLDDGLRAIDPGLQPSETHSTRNDADTGWVFRNTYGFLAFVADDGTLYSGYNGVTAHDLESGIVYDSNLTLDEAVRGTTSEVR